MNRRKFAIKSILGLVGLSIFPINSIFSKNNINSLNIGLPKEHVRHGLLANDGFTPISQLGIKIKRDIFYKNGIDKCPNNNDSYLTTIKYKGETLSFFKSTTEIIKNGLKVYSRKISGRQKNQVINLNNGLICHTSGIINIDGNTIPPDRGVVISSPTSVSGSGEYMIIDRLD